MYKSVLRKVSEALASEANRATVSGEVEVDGAHSAGISGLKSAFTTTWPGRTCQHASETGLCFERRSGIAGTTSKRSVCFTGVACQVTGGPAVPF
jgi:hypothetical protein